MMLCRTSPRIAALLASLALVASACETATAPTTPLDDEARPEPATDLQVIATTSILGDIVGNVVGDTGTVEVLMGPGVDPHGYQPSAADAAKLREADLVVANGLGLEESLIAALEAAEEDGVRVFEVAPQLDPIEFGAGAVDDHGHDEGDDHGHDDEDGEGDDHGHDHGPEDPHVWFDPLRMADAAELLALELAEVSPALEEAEWLERGAAYAAELRALDEELVERFAAIPDERRVLVTNHDALGYLAHRYDFEVLGTVIPGASTQAETDPRSFAELAETLEEAGVEVIFAENTDSTRLAEQLASEVVGRSDLEVEVVGLFTDALGGPGSGAETYLDLLRTNAGIITEALGA